MRTELKMLHNASLERLALIVTRKRTEQSPVLHQSGKESKCDSRYSWDALRFSPSVLRSKRAYCTWPGWWTSEMELPVA